MNKGPDWTLRALFRAIPLGLPRARWTKVLWAIKNPAEAGFPNT